MQYPEHIAIIPDGNRTWAKQKWLPSFQGHIKGKENANTLAQYLFEKTPIKVLTLRWLSTENLKERSQDELEHLFELFETVTEGLKDLMRKEQINLRRMGSAVWLPTKLVDFFRNQENEFTFASNRYLCLCINYWGRDEIIRGIEKRQGDGAPKDLLNEKDFWRYLDFWDLPVVDLVIRTKGEIAKRVSGFMSWRIGYAEIFFSELFFPDFTTEQLQQSLLRYDSVCQHRNFGK